MACSRAAVVSATAALGALVGSALFGGTSGLSGMAIGLLAAGFGVTGLWLVTSLVERAAAGRASSARGVLLPALFFLFKLPVFFGLGVLAQRLGRAGLGCFLAGVVLVYFGLVVGALAAQAGARDELSK